MAASEIEHCVTVLGGEQQISALPLAGGTHGIWVVVELTGDQGRLAGVAHAGAGPPTGRYVELW